MSRFRGQFEAILAALSFGTTPILVKKGLRGGLHPFYGVTIAIGTALLVNILFVFLSGQWRKSFPLKQRGLLFVALAAGCNTAAALTYFGAMSLGKVSLVVPISCIYPLFTILAVFFFLRGSETLDLWTVIGTVLIIAGIILAL
jgi:uncharacterized membrane protein